MNNAWNESCSSDQKYTRFYLFSARTNTVTMVDADIK